MDAKNGTGNELVRNCFPLQAGTDLIISSRFFAPAVGVNEDPVTGSAHCCLGPFWKERLGKNEFIAYQVSLRGGIVRVRMKGERVYLGGQAVTILRGELIVSLPIFPAL